jgi:hypothetical protein
MVPTSVLPLTPANEVLSAAKPGLRPAHRAERLAASSEGTMMRSLII